MSLLGNAVTLACLLLLSHQCFSATYKMFSCFTDVCNRYDADQFCSTKERKCRDCSTISDECSTLDLPVNCTNWCIKYNVKQALQQAKARHCPKLEEIVNGIHNASSAESYPPGHVVAVTCNIGYRLTGQSILKCRDYGQWSDREPKCEDILCRPLNKIKDGSHNGSHNVQYKPGTTITYSCNMLYIFVGSTTTSCNTEGQWTHHQPVCNNGWKTVAIVALALLGCILLLLLVWGLIKFRRHLRKRRKHRNKPNSPKKNGCLKEAAESEHLIEEKGESTISLHDWKQRQQNVIPTDGNEPNAVTALAKPNFPTASFEKSQVQGEGVQIQFNAFNYNNGTETRNTLLGNIPESLNGGNESEAAKATVTSTVETRRNEFKAAENISVEESATKATAQPEEGNESLMKVDVVGNTVVYEKCEMESDENKS